MERYDFVVVGRGLAGSYLAGKLANIGSVALVDDGKLSSSSLAQGGIAAVSYKNPEDSFDKHINDTLSAGGFLNDRNVVSYVVQQAESEIEKLYQMGVAFSSSLHREGGHSESRIFHHSDNTGVAVMAAMNATLDKVMILTDTIATKILVKNKQIQGLMVSYDGKSRVITTPVVILATGGASGLYKYSSNDHLGSGMCLAYQAGAELEGLEFTQFHPTYSASGLLSEAMRGEGAKITHKGKSIFRGEYNELSPRDVVSREIFFYMQQHKLSSVGLDATKIKDVEQKFPTIYESVKINLGLDISKEEIPITPVAHYSCGGIKVDINGETRVKNLYALGEVSNSGLHGANRLASNSLLECLVFASSIYTHLEKKKISLVAELEAPTEDIKTTGNAEILNKIREIMWRDVGIIRSDDSLHRALEAVNRLESDDDFYTASSIFLAKLTIQHSLARRQSIGCYYNIDRI